MPAEIFKKENRSLHNRLQSPSSFILSIALMNLILNLLLSRNVKMSGTMPNEAVDGGYGNPILSNDC
jgi:hypothetical protein